MGDTQLAGDYYARPNDSRRLARALGGFAALVIAGTCATFGVYAWRSYDAAIDEARQANASLAHTLEEHTARNIQSIDLVLSGVADFLRIHPGFETPGDPTIFGLLHRRANATSGLTAIVIVDRHGRLVYHSEAPDLQPIDVSDRAYFTVHRDNPTRHLTIGEPFLGRISQKWLLGLSRRITDADGAFAGVVVGIVRPERLSRDYAGLRPSQDGVVALFLNNGVYLARTPGHGQFLGRSAADGPLFSRHLPAAPVGTYDSRDADDPVRRLVAYRKLPGSPLVVAVSTSLDIVVANWRRSLLEYGAVALLIGIGFALIAHAMIRQIRQRIASEATVAGLSREIERKSAQLEAALGNMSQGLCMFDSDQRLILCNRRYLELYNLPGELVRPGITLQQIVEISARAGSFAPERAKKLIQELTAIGTSQEPRVFHQQLATGRIIEVVHGPVPMGGFVATYTDITDQARVTSDLRNAKEQAELANRTKSEFLANMSHELRTPLNAIIGFSQIMTEQLFGPIGNPRYREYAGDVLHSSQHLLQIINDILDMAKIEAGRVELNETAIEVVSVARACLRLVRERAESAGIKLHLDIPDDLPELFGDERLVKQILLNLVTNAVKFTPRGGYVTISGAIDEEGGWRLAVTDTGIGIAPENLPKVMTPFGQIDSAYSRAHGGTGLGLSIVRALVDLHGAAFDIDSEVGRGTTVIARFPPERVMRARPKAIKAFG